MVFGRKNKIRKCENCGGKSEKKFSFCPYCGSNFLDSSKDLADFGLLGKNDFAQQDEFVPQLGMMDKLLSSMVNNMMKNLDKQFKNLGNGFDGAEVKGFPNGIKIKISGPFDVQRKVVKPKQERQRVEIGEEQIKRMSSLPRAKAKTSVKRLGDKVVYELVTPGVNSANDVFVSKLENGYEIKAIGSKKVYVNSVPINLPLRKYSILKNKLLVEFLSETPLEE